MAKKRDLPKYVYKRGNRLWIRIKDETGKWVDKGTPFDVTQVEQARQLVQAALKRVETQVISDDPTKMTVRKYIKRWADERTERGVRSAKTDRKRLLKYVGDILDMLIEEVRTMHVRDMMRALRKMVNEGAIAPRTALHVYSALHNVFENAVVDELITSSPVRVKDGELPKKVDKDPEWRSQATYLTAEVVQLISVAEIPVERRVQYALKSIAGMRHGEVAAICWRHYDATIEPLGRLDIVQAWDSLEGEIKDTKTGIARAVPVHPTLAKILLAWRSSHWERIYGRPPTPDDFIVPTRTFNCVDAGDAGKAMQSDFDRLGLRKKAGKQRHRGGHDLRSWYKTQVIEDGAQWLLVRRTTHAPPKDMDGGYERFSWGAICREVAKLTIDIDGDPLELAAGSLQVEASASARWRKSATPMGFEPTSVGVSEGQKTQTLVDKVDGEQSQDTSTIDYIAAASLFALEKALLAGDQGRALAITKRMLARAKPSCGRAHHHAPRDVVHASHVSLVPHVQDDKS